MGGCGPFAPETRPERKERSSLACRVRDDDSSGPETGPQNEQIRGRERAGLKPGATRQRITERFLIVPGIYSPDPGLRPSAADSARKRQRGQVGR